jgi:hypothetical protein
MALSNIIRVSHSNDCRTNDCLNRTLDKAAVGINTATELWIAVVEVKDS